MSEKKKDERQHKIPVHPFILLIIIAHLLFTKNRISPGFEP